MSTSTPFYVGITEESIDGLHRMGPALHFYLWLIKNRWFRDTAESRPHIGKWVQKGLIVVPFVRKDYCKVAGVAPRTVTKYIAQLQAQGDIRVVSRGNNVGVTNAPVVVAIGIWQALPEGKRWAMHDRWLDHLDLAGPASPQNANELRQLLEVQTRTEAHTHAQFNADTTDTSGRNLPPPPSTDIPESLEKSHHLSLTGISNENTSNRYCCDNAQHDMGQPEWQDIYWEPESLSPAGEETAEADDTGFIPHGAAIRIRRRLASGAMRRRQDLFDAVAPYVAGSSDPEAIAMAASEIGRTVSYLHDCEITPEQVPQIAEFIHTDCFVTHQERIHFGSWEKFLASWISHIKVSEAEQRPVEPRRAYAEDDSAPAF